MARDAEPGRPGGKQGRMEKVRINDLARELEVKSKSILDLLPEIGVKEKKTHSSSIEPGEAEKVRHHFQAQVEAASRAKESRAARPAPSEIKTKIDLSKISKPGDVLKAITKQTTPVVGPRAAAPAAVKPAAPAIPAEKPVKPGAAAVAASKPAAAVAPGAQPVAPPGSPGPAGRSPARRTERTSQPAGGCDAAAPMIRAARHPGYNPRPVS